MRLGAGEMAAGLLVLGVPRAAGSVAAARVVVVEAALEMAGVASAALAEAGRAVMAGVGAVAGAMEDGRCC